MAEDERDEYSEKRLLFNGQNHAGIQQGYMETKALLIEV